MTLIVLSVFLLSSLKPSTMKSITISTSFKSKITMVFWITFAWLIIAFHQYLDNYSLLINEGCIDQSYNPWDYLKGVIFSAIAGGLVGGTLLVSIWENWLRNKAFFNAIIYIVFSYVVIYVTLTFVTVWLFSQIGQGPLPSSETFKATGLILINPTALPNIVYWLVIMLATMLVLLIRDKFGPGIFQAFLRGRYFHPQREERIFMFMDLKSATTIAEELGEEQYFNFLNDTFKTVTTPILDTNGEIYQYVGDEIVISWKKKEGHDHAKCILCYNAVKKTLNENETYFKEKYGHAPQFKAGIHVGHVVAGEIGSIKRDIVYSGDVLNTTSRIQAKCNELGVEILISKKLGDLVKPILGHDIFKELGELNLKGKLEKVPVLTLVS